MTSVTDVLAMGQWKLPPEAFKDSSLAGPTDIDKGKAQLVWGTFAGRPDLKQEQSKQEKESMFPYNTLLADTETALAWCQGYGQC